MRRHVARSTWVAVVAPHTADILRRAPGVKLVALFAVEHGINGEFPAGKNYNDYVDKRTGLPVRSLYDGKTREPTKDQLKDLDALVIDLQDIGTRSYTFISALKKALAACFQHGVEVIVLDRPNPLGGLKADGIDYRGTLYVGIMVTATGPKVVEFNVRFGDPECQVLMPSLETDPVQIMEDIAHGRFRPSAVKLRPGATIIVVLAAGGYPGEIRKGDPITLPASLPEGVDIVHGGTKRLPDGRVVTTGGRVLGVVAHGPTLQEAARRAYAVVPQIRYEGCHYRRDIGYRQLRRDGVV
mgnify:CR=1 FL=1